MQVITASRYPLRTKRRQHFDYELLPLSKDKAFQLLHQWTVNPGSDKLSVKSAQDLDSVKAMKQFAGETLAGLPSRLCSAASLLKMHLREWGQNKSLQEAQAAFQEWKTTHVQEIEQLAQDEKAQDERHRASGIWQAPVPRLALNGLLGPDADVRHQTSESTEASPLAARAAPHFMSEMVDMGFTRPWLIDWATVQLFIDKKCAAFTSRPLSKEDLKWYFFETGLVLLSHPVSKKSHVTT